MLTAISSRTKIRTIEANQSKLQQLVDEPYQEDNNSRLDKAENERKITNNKSNYKNGFLKHNTKTHLHS